MAEIYVNAGDVWKKIKKLHVKQSEAWLPVKKGYVRSGGVWKHFFQNAIVIDVVGTFTDFNLYDAVVAQLGHAPAVAIEVLLNIQESSVLGATTSANAALIIGQFPAGSNIIVVNNGWILGAGGVPSAGNGGTAINADFPNQTVTITNNYRIFAGGGAGGQGGTGGAGGAGEDVLESWPDGTTKRRHVGGVGGVGGAGGYGGHGEGFRLNSTKLGSVGAVGFTGGPSADSLTGPGGQGGQGGTGGQGGYWGNPGYIGERGGTGSEGKGSAPYWYEKGGEPGEPGTSGKAGGAKGRYLVKGTASVTFNNHNWVAGGVA